MHQAQAKVELRLAEGFEPSVSDPFLEPTAENQEIDGRIERCIARSNELIAEASAFLNEPMRPPRLLTAVVETAERNTSAGLLLAKTTAEKAKQRSASAHGSAHGSAKGLVEMQAARWTPLPESPLGRYPDNTTGAVVVYA